jgi:hypothetical protein
LKKCISVLIFKVAITVFNSGFTDPDLVFQLIYNYYFFGTISYLALVESGSGLSRKVGSGMVLYFRLSSEEWQRRKNTKRLLVHKKQQGKMKERSDPEHRSSMDL